MTPQPSAARRGTFSERSSAVLLGLLVACAAAKLWGVRLPWEVLL